jgi:hypothetical protein
MGFFTSIASLLGLELEEIVARMRKDAVAWGLIGALLAIGVVFALVGVNAALSEVWGPVVAPFVIAGAGFLLALLVYAAVSFMRAEARRREEERRKAAERTALVTTAAISALPAVMKSGALRKLGLPLGGAVAVAFLLARSNRHHGTPPDGDAR